MTETTVHHPQPHILVVDDDEIMRSAARESLIEADFSVSEAENGVLAMQALEKGRPDIILLDVMMPEMDGFATARAIRKLAGFEMVPILIMTALDDLDSINHAYEAGATDFITKPINWVILVERVRYMTRYVQMMNDQKRLQAELQQAQKLEAVATLAGGVAHDFNNLLHVVMSSAELLQMRQPDGAPQMDELDDIIQAVDRGGKLVRQLLTYSRNIKSEKRPIKLNQKLNQVHQMMQRTLPKMIAIECRLEKDLFWVNADEVQVEQVLMNLAINAKDAMPNGGKLVFETANIRRPQKHGLPSSTHHPLNWIRLTVSDTGHGMDSKTREQVFEPFFSTKVPGKGTGLGLSMVHGIVRNHDGRVICRSVPGEGTDFHIYLPAAKKIQKKALTMEKKTRPRGHETILLVDDDETIRHAGQKMLEKAGYTVFTASDGETALKNYRENTTRIHLVLLDLMMPGMGGGKCLQALQKMDPSVKVVIISGHYPENEGMEAIEACACACLRKPYTTDQLLDTIQSVLGDLKHPAAAPAARHPEHWEKERSSDVA